MKSQFLAVILGGIAAFSFTSCSQSTKSAGNVSTQSAVRSSGTADAAAAALDTSGASPNPAAETKTFERKIIKTADLIFEAPSPEETQNKISALVEAKKGFVVKSDTRERNVGEDSPKTISMTLRVPVENFEEILREVKKQGVDRIISETVSGEDVTEQFVDTEARLKAKKAVEAQYLEVLKQARTVKDTLEVQEKLGEIRTEIESVEGRLRLLQNQTAFSTINIEIQPTAAIGSSVKGFGYEIRSAFSEGFSMAGAFLLLGLRLIIILVPLLLVFGVPLYLITQWLKRRRKRILDAEQIK